MQNAQRKLDKVGRKMQKLGAGLTVGVTAPLVALSAIAIKNFDEQAKALAQVEAGLKSTGNAVGFTTKELEKQAEALQNNSLFGDEVILKDATAQLLTFTNITGEAFSRTQQAALDLSTRLDGDLKSASIQLGKALNDPIANLSALSRSGIQFSKDQKILIKSLVEGGKIAEAQGVILSELEKQYGGSAKAAAAAGLGPFTQFKNILGDIAEDFGAIIVDGLNPLIVYLKDVATRFKNLSPQTKKWIVILGGVAAAAGPLLALAGTILPAIGTGLALLTGPIGLVVAGLAAIGVVIYKNWQPIKAQLIEIANYFIDLYNESALFRIAVEGITASFKSLWAVGKFVFNALGSIIAATATNIKAAFGNIGDFVKAILTGDLAALPGILEKGFREGFSAAGALVADLENDFKTLEKSLGENIGRGVSNALSTRKYKLLGTNVDTQGLQDKVATAVQSGLETGASNGGPFTPQTEKLELSTQGLVENPLGTIAENLKESTEGIKIALAETSQELTAFQQNSEIVGGAVGDAFSNMTNRFIDSLGLAETGFEGFVKTLAQTVTKLISIALSQALANSIAGATSSGSATGPAAVFTTPAFIATAVGGVLAAFAAIPKFATGGFVPGNSFFGDTQLARVNSGELILNIAQQKNLAGAIKSNGGVVVLQPELKFSNRQFAIALNRVNELNGRVS